MPQNIFPISPVWTLRNLFYTILGLPVPLIFIGVFWINMENSKDWTRPLLYIIVLLGMTVITLPVNFIMNVLRLINFHYSLDEKNITIKEGIIQKQTRIINYSAIQTVTIKQGLFEKLTRIATLQLENAAEAGGQYMLMNSKQENYLAGSLGSYANMVIIPGLYKDDAQELRTMLLDKIKNTQTVELGI